MNIGIIEPTLGLPVIPILISKVSSYEKIDALVVPVVGNLYVEFKRVMQTTAKVPVLALDEFIKLHSKDNLIKIAGIQKSSTLEATTLCPSNKSLHKAEFEKVPIGLFLASFVCRHNNNLCEEWAPQLTDLRNLLGQWIAFARMVELLIESHSIKFALFTHSVYFWGFIAEFLSKKGIKTLISGATKYPISPINGQFDNNQQKKTTLVQLPLSSYEIAKAGNMSFCEQKILKSINKSTKIDMLSRSALLQYNNFYDLYNNTVITTEQDLEQIFESKGQKSIDKIFIIFLHSFTDNLFSWGYEGFDNLFEYFLEVGRLIDRFYPDSKIIVRPHPDIFRVTRSDRIEMDLELTTKLINRLKVIHEKTYVCKPTISVSDILLKNKNAIAVSHHSNNVARECLYLRRHCIASVNAIMVRIRSGIHHNFACREDLEQIFKNKTFSNDPELLVHKDEAIAGSRLATYISLYDPTYPLKIQRLNSCSDPDFCLAAGFSNLHTEYSPSCSDNIKNFSINSLDTYKNFIRKSYGKIAMHALDKYCTNILRTYW